MTNIDKAAEAVRSAESHLTSSKRETKRAEEHLKEAMNKLADARNNKIALKPCPIDGHKAEYATKPRNSRYTIKPWDIVRCTHCKLQTGGRDSKANARIIWNSLPRVK